MGTEIITKNFIAFFKKYPPSFARTYDSKLIKCAGKRAYYDDFESLQKIFTADKIIHFKLTEWYTMEPMERISWFSDFVEHTFRYDLVEREKIRHGVRNLEVTDDMPDPEYILENLRPCRVLGDSRKEAGFRFLDRKTNELTEYDYHSVVYSLRRKFPRESIEDYISTFLHLREEYNPHDLEKLKPHNPESKVYVLNRYRPPEWLPLLADAKPRLDPKIKQLLDHLLPKSECQEFVFNWIYHSWTSRAGTYLYFCGGQGSGKNTLAHLLTKIHGEYNSSHPKQDSFKNRFNHYLKDKRFIFFDEFNCRFRQDKDILKSIINRRIQIEGKNRDHEDIDIHASYFLANNSLEAIGIDPIDRRFSVPDISDEPILQVCSREWIRGFYQALESNEFIANFMAWILAEFKNPKWHAEEPYQRRRFEEIVLATARMGIAETLQKVLQKEQDEYDYYEEKESFKRLHKGQSYPNLVDWQRFFRDVKLEGKPLGEIQGKMFKPRLDLRTGVSDEDRLE